MTDSDRLLERVERLNQIGVALSAEKNHHRLLEMILFGAREMTGADGGTLYSLQEDGTLRFEIIQTNSLGLSLGGTGDPTIGFPPIPLQNEAGQPNNLVVVYTALSGKMVNIADAYQAEGFDFSGTRRFDEQLGYRSKSFLSVPLKNHEEDVIGVLQLINATDPVSGEIGTFSDQDQLFAASLASQAAVTLTKNQLINDLKGLFESLIQLIASAIDEKSPYTGDHCRRVPVLTMMLARAVGESVEEPFADFELDEQELYELEVAAWLHDCGKLITPVNVVDKATKLETIYDRLDLVSTRFEVIRRDLEIARLKAGQQGSDLPLPEQLDGSLPQMIEDLGFLADCNQGQELLSDADRQRVKEIASRYRWIDRQGEEMPALTEDEVTNLLVVRGTLNEQEREVINHHIISTINMLDLLPFPKQLSKVPEIAGSHHERYDGQGYPAGLTGDQMSVPARILAIADIFEALTARDRPYKKGNSLAKALGIMRSMRDEGHIDPDLFRIFVHEKVYLRYAEEYLTPDQIVPIDPQEILAD